MQKRPYEANNEFLERGANYGKETGKENTDERGAQVYVCSQVH